MGHQRARHHPGVDPERAAWLTAAKQLARVVFPGRDDHPKTGCLTFVAPHGQEARVRLDSGAYVSVRLDDLTLQQGAIA